MKIIFSYVVLLALVTGSHPTRLVADDAIHVPSALLTVVERIDVPAAEEGLLTSLTVREGDLVEPGQVLGVTDTRSARCSWTRWCKICNLPASSPRTTRACGSREEHELAQVELERAHKVNEGFANSVSAKEIDRLKLSVERTRLEIEFAQFEQSQNAAGRTPARVRPTTAAAFSTPLSTPHRYFVNHRLIRKSGGVAAVAVLVEVEQVRRALRAQRGVQLRGLLGHHVEVVAAVRDQRRRLDLGQIVAALLPDRGAVAAVARDARLQRVDGPGGRSCVACARRGASTPRSASTSRSSPWKALVPRAADVRNAARARARSRGSSRTSPRSPRRGRSRPGPRPRSPRRRSGSCRCTTRRSSRSCRCASVTARRRDGARAGRVGRAAAVEPVDHGGGAERLVRAARRTGSRPSGRCRATPSARRRSRAAATSAS